MKDYIQLPNTYRPRIRWWIPGNMVEDREMIAEMHDMKDAGFYGAEICPMPSRIERWGDERWYKRLRNVLAEAARMDFQIDLMMTQGWPLALPTITDVSDPAQGAVWELDGTWIDGISQENPFCGLLPVSQEALEDAVLADGKVQLFAITTARYTDKERKILSFESARTLNLNQIINNRSSETEIAVSYCPDTTGEHVLFAWWLHPAGIKTGNHHQIDHLGKAGTEQLIHYYETIAFPALGEEKSNLTSFFVDSLEFETHLDYTPGFFEKFEEMYGYDIIKYLPAVYDQDSYGVFFQPEPDFSFDQYNTQLKNTYAEFVTDLYVENHLKPLTAFAQKHGINLRYQTGYGKTMELAKTSCHVSIPETETLYGRDIIDFYRIQAGSIHLLSKDQYSIETACITANRGGDKDSGNYEQRFIDQLWHIQRAYYGGVNLPVYHGYSYKGHYEGSGSQNGMLPDILWPGYQFAGIHWGNSWGERQPNWIAAKNISDFLTRNQYVLRQGTPKIDLAVYRHSYFEKIDNGGAEILFHAETLENWGYNFEFISPCHFDLLTLSDDHTRLAVDGPGYRALIFDHQKELPSHVAEQLCEWADKGFPVFFIGCIPDADAFYLEKETVYHAAKKKLACKSALPFLKLLKEKPIYFCRDIEELRLLLQTAGIFPRVSYQAPVTIWNSYRSDEQTDYIYLYHHGDTESYKQIFDREIENCTINLCTNATPYWLDAWTGTVTAVDNFTYENGRLALLAELYPGESRILILQKDEPLSEKTIVSSALKNCAGLLLKNWHLNLESWTEGSCAVETQKTVHSFELEQPVYWTQLEGQNDVSGVGSYETTFFIEDITEKKFLLRIDGAVDDVFVPEINGYRIPADQIRKQADLTPYVKPGENMLKILIGSTLLNAVLLYYRKNGIIDTENPDTRNPGEGGLSGNVFIDIM